jgi:hypothetical protein
MNLTVRFCFVKYEILQKPKGMAGKTFADTRKIRLFLFANASLIFHTARSFHLTLPHLRWR